MPLSRNFQIGRIPYDIFDFLMRPTRKSAVNSPTDAILKEFVALAETMDSPSVLELGSRNVLGVTQADTIPNPGRYVGLDVLDGENVDVVGDIHQLSSYFEDEEFDLMYSMSVFEHLMFPWKAALEINKVLKTGGYVYIATHPSWPQHEMPWDFWRFPKNAFHSIFNSTTGFEVISLAEGGPLRSFPLEFRPQMRTIYKYPVNSLVSCLARKIGPYDRERVRWDMAPGDVTDTMYPPKGEPSRKWKLKHLGPKAK